MRDSPSEIKKMTTPKDIRLKEELDKIDWKEYIEYGTIRVHVKSGKLTLVTIERTYTN